MLPILKDISKVISLNKLNGGINLADKNEKIKDNQFAYLQNMLWDNGFLKKRTGYGIYKTFDEEIVDIYEFNSILIIITTSKIITLDKKTMTETVQLENLQNTKRGFFFERGTSLLYFSGNGIYELNSYLSTPKIETIPVNTIKASYEQIDENVFVYDSSEGTKKVLIYDVENKTTYEKDLISEKVQNATKIISELSDNDSGYYHSIKETIYGTDINGNYAIEIKKYELSNSIYWPNLPDNYVFKRLTTGLYSICGWQSKKVLKLLRLDETTNTIKTVDTVTINTSMSYTGQLESFYIDNKVMILETGKKLEGRAPIYIRLYDDSFNEVFNTTLSESLELSTEKIEVSIKDTLLTIAVPFYKKVGLYECKNNVLRRIGSVEEDYFITKIDNSYALVNDKLKIIKVINTQKGYIEYSDSIVYNGDYREFGYVKNGVYLTEKIIDTSNKVQKLTPYIPTTYKFTDRTTYINPEQYNAATDEFYVESEVNEINLPVSYADIEILSVKNKKNEEIKFEVSGTDTTIIEIEGNSTYKIKCKTKNFTNKIEKCNIGTAFGGNSNIGSSGTRLFVSGNENQPTTYFYSDVNNFTYFPENNYDMLDFNSQKITAFSKMHDFLIIFKEKSIFTITYNYDGEKVLFPVKLLSDELGCTIADSVQIIDNKPVFANEDGIYLIDRTDVVSEKNVKPISHNISGERGYNKHLLTDKINASSIKYNGKYFLNIDDTTYVYDFKQSFFYDSGDVIKSQERLTWYLLTNIKAHKMFVIDEKLAFINSNTIYVFNDSNRDINQPVNAIIETKQFDFGSPEELKDITHLWISMPSGNSLTVKIKDNMQDTILRDVIKRTNPLSLRIRHRRCKNISFELEHTKDDTFSLSEIKIEYAPLKVRR